MNITKETYCLFDPIAVHTVSIKLNEDLCLDLVFLQHCLQGNLEMMVRLDRRSTSFATTVALWSAGKWDMKKKHAHVAPVHHILKSGPE